jgi:hypothetical protein
VAVSIPFKNNSGLKGKQRANCRCLHHRWFPFERSMCYLSLGEWAYLELNDPFSTLKTMICRTYSSQNVTPVSQGNKVLDSLHLTQILFFEIHTWFINFLELAYLQENETFSTLKSINCRSYPSKTYGKSHRKTMWLQLLLLSRWFSF